MLIPQPNLFPFKCAINGPNSKLVCFHSFSNHVWSLSDNTRVELPYAFPNIEGIRWDYDSFLTYIYRYLCRTEGNCGLEFEILNSCQHEYILKVKSYTIRILDETTFALYVLMELALFDWESEIKKKSSIKKFYTENELITISE